jgi:cytoskeletal protein RodZ
MSNDDTRPLGEWLRQQREALGISLEQAHEATRIRQNFLEALESDNWDALPNPIVARGFLRNYAAYLDLDPNEALDRHTGIVGPLDLGPPPSTEESSFEGGLQAPVALHEPSAFRTRRWLFAALLVVLIGALGFLGWKGYPYVVDWIAGMGLSQQATPTLQPTKATLTTATATVSASVSASTVVDSPTGTSQPTAPPATAAEAPTLEITLTPTFTPSPSPTPSPPVYTGIFVELVFTDTSWIQVSTDGVRQFQGELETGTYRSWYGRRRVELRVGNAGVVEVTINGERLGTLGDVGEVVDRVFEIVDDQVSEVTPTQGPTSTPAPEVTLPPPQVEVTPTLAITGTGTVTPTASSP